MLPMNTEYQNYIDGRFVTHEGETLEVRNPATHDLLAHVPDADASVVDEAVAAARRAQPAWEQLPAIERAGYLRQVSAKLREHSERLAKTISREQGKVLPLARVEVAFTADYIDYMAEWARRLEGEVLNSDRPGEHMFLLRKPLGVVAGVLPWNFPFFLIARKMAPALITGNTIVVKPSEETPLNALEFTRLLAETDMPPGVFNLVCGLGAGTGAALTSHKDVDLITFTGSVDTGIRIMQAAAPNLTRVNLELGGKAPAIVCADADLDLAVKGIVASRICFSGQVCNCCERVYVHESIKDAFLNKLVAAMESVTVGAPADGTDICGLVSSMQFDKVKGMVDRAVSGGAKVECGGDTIPAGPKYAYQPTVLTGVKQSDEIVQEEIFGPVLPVLTFKTLDEAFDLARIRLVLDAIVAPADDAIEDATLLRIR